MFVLFDIQRKGAFVSRCINYATQVTLHQPNQGFVGVYQCNGLYCRSRDPVAGLHRLAPTGKSSTSSLSFSSFSFSFFSLWLARFLTSTTRDGRDSADEESEETDEEEKSLQTEERMVRPGYEVVVLCKKRLRRLLI